MANNNLNMAKVAARADRVGGGDNKSNAKMNTVQPQNQTQTKTKKDSKLSAGAIAGITVGSIVLVLAIAYGVYKYNKKD